MAEPGGPPGPPGGPVEVAVVVAARPGTIFRYFTDPARFARWMGETWALDPEPSAGRLPDRVGRRRPGRGRRAGPANVAGADLDGRFRWVTGFWDPPPESPGPAEAG